MSESLNQIKSIGEYDLFGRFFEIKQEKRGDLIVEFAEKTKYSKGFIAHKTKGLNIEDLRYIRSCIKEDLAMPWCKGYRHAFDAELKKWWK